MVSLLAEFSVANQAQRSYTHERGGLSSRPVEDRLGRFPEMTKTEGLAQVFASLGCGTFHRLDEFSAPFTGPSGAPVTAAT